MARVLKAHFVGFATDSTQHVMAPQELVYETVEPVRRKVPLGAKLLAIGWILAGAYILIQGSINTFG